MKKNYVVLVTIILVFFGFVIWGIIADKKLESQGLLLNATTLEWASGAKMGMSLKYEFYYKEKKIISNNSFNKIRGLRNFENKNFPVMYDPQIGSSQLLIEPSDFRRFNLRFPDSLSWILPYLK